MVIAALVREARVDSISRPLLPIAYCRFEINEDFAVETLVLERAFIDRRSVQPRDNASRNISLDLSGRPSAWDPHRNLVLRRVHRLTGKCQRDAPAYRRSRLPVSVTWHGPGYCAVCCACRVPFRRCLTSSSRSKLDLTPTPVRGRRRAMACPWRRRRSRSWVHRRESRGNAFACSRHP